MNRQCRWAERRSWSVQKPIDLETRGCIQTVKELYREHSWHHQFHVHLFLSGRFLILYSGSFHMHSQGCTFVWKTLTWISSICTFYLLGQKNIQTWWIESDFDWGQFNFSSASLEGMHSISFKLTSVFHIAAVNWFGELNVFTSLIDVKWDWLQSLSGKRHSWWCFI